MLYKEGKEGINILTENKEHDKILVYIPPGLPGPQKKNNEWKKALEIVLKILLTAETLRLTRIDPITQKTIEIQFLSKIQSPAVIPVECVSIFLHSYPLLLYYDGRRK